MKKIIMVLVSGVFCMLLNTNFATAQKATGILFTDAKIDNLVNSFDENKADARIVDPNDKTDIKKLEANLKAAKANLKVTNFLDKNFKNVSGLVVDAEAKAIVATFKMNEKSARVVYNKKGRWLYSIISYKEDQLAEDIRSLVKKNYDGFAISLVQEINQGNITVHLIHLENCSNYKKVWVANGEITLCEDFTKSL